MPPAPVARQSNPIPNSSPYAIDYSTPRSPRYCPTPEYTRQWLLRTKLEPIRRRLESEFSSDPWPTRYYMASLARQLSLPHHTVYDWFALRRGKEIGQAGPVKTAPDPRVFPTYRSWCEHVAIYGTEKYRSEARESLQVANKPFREPPNWRRWFEPPPPPFRPKGYKHLPEHCAESYLYTPGDLPRSYQRCDPHPVPNSGIGLSATGSFRQPTIFPMEKQYAPPCSDERPYGPVSPHDSYVIRPSWDEDAPPIGTRDYGQLTEDDSSSDSGDSEDGDD